MALLASLAALLAALVIVLIAAGAGITLFNWLGFVPSRPFLRLSLGVSLGVIALELGFFAAQLFSRPGIACAIVIVFLAALAFPQISGVVQSLLEMALRVRSSRAESVLAACTALILLWEGLAAEAPLTGSDAMHYHFAWPLFVLRNGFHPDLSVAHSLLTGEGHALIFAGLAFGSERLSLALLFVGGALAAFVGAGISREWVSRPVALLVAITFLVTPVVFWQMTSAGAPDLWMSVFVGSLALCLAEATKDCGAGLAATCGVLAGGIAGAKYTGAIFALVAFIYFIYRTRSARRSALFVCGAVGAGIWPYLRNAIWTGDPVFPFASRWLHSIPLNAFALDLIRKDTGAGEHHTLAQIVTSPFFASMDAAHLGFWQFFGPLCLLLLPFFLVLCRRSPLWRSIVMFLFAAGLMIAVTSGRSRFLVPLFPLALAAAFAGCAGLWQIVGRWSHAVIVASVSGFLALGFGGMLLYSSPALLVAVGATHREEYLAQRAPDYELCEFANEALASASPDEKVLVFFRHIYYLRVPFIDGDPGGSWLVDPAELRDSQSWELFFRRHHISYVLRGDRYPEALAPALKELERDGVLVPFVERNLTDFVGNRLAGVREPFKAAILAFRQ